MLRVVTQHREAKPTAGTWSLLRPIGEGLGGTAWLAVGPDGTEAVVKLLGEAPGEEVLALSRLVHPSIPALLEAGPNYVVMERAGGIPVTQLLSGSEADAYVGARVLTSVASALALVHRRGSHHGDVSAANIHVSAERVWLLDFGHARSREGGTPMFMAPERFRGLGGPASDVYALGLVVWALLEGQEPPAPSLRDGAPLPRTVNGPPWLSDMVHRMLAPSAEHRPTAQEVVDECLARGMEDPPPDAALFAARARGLLVERPVHSHLRRWFAHRSALALDGARGLGVTHTARWAVQELTAAGARVVEVVAGGGELGPLRRLAADPAWPQPFEIDLHALKGVVLDTVDRIIEGMAEPTTLVVHGEGMPSVVEAVIHQLHLDAPVSVLWVGGKCPSWISARIVLSPWGDAELLELARQLLGGDVMRDGLDELVAIAAGSPRTMVAALMHLVRLGAVTYLDGQASLRDFDHDELVQALAVGVALSERAAALGSAIAAWGRALPIEVALTWAGMEAIPVEEWRSALQELIATGLVRVRGTEATVAGPLAAARFSNEPAMPLCRLKAFTYGEGMGVEPDHWLELATAASLGSALGKRATAPLEAVAKRDVKRACALVRDVWAVCSERDRTPALALIRVRLLADAGHTDEAWTIACAESSVELGALMRASVLATLLQQRDHGLVAERLGERVEGEHPALRLVRVQQLAVRGEVAAADELVHTIAPDGLDEHELRRWRRIRAKLARVQGRTEVALTILEEQEELDGAWHDEMASCFLTAGLARDAARHYAAAARAPGWSLTDRANLNNQCGTAWALAGDLIPARVAMTTAASIFARLDLPGPGARCAANLAESARELGRLGAARQHAERALHLAERAGDAFVRRGVLSNLVALDLEEGLLALAGEHLTMCRAVEKEHGLPTDLELEVRSLTLRYVRGDPSALVDVRVLAGTDDARSDPKSRAMLLLLECRLLLRDGLVSRELVSERAQQAMQPLIASGRSADLAIVRAGFAELFLAVDDAVEAERLATAARLWAEEFQRRPIRAQADRVLSRVQELSPHRPDPEQQIGRLVELSVQILGERDPRRVMDALASAARDLTGADRAFVVRASLVDDPDPTEQTDEVYTEGLDSDEILASAGASAEDRPSWTVVRRCIVSGQEVLVHDLSERDDLNRARSVRRMRLQATLAVPFLRDGKPYGVIYVDRMGDSFDSVRARVGVLRFLASYAGVALTNALHAEQLRERVELAEEVFHDVQNLLTPVVHLAEDPEGDIGDIRDVARTVRKVAGRFERGDTVEGSRAIDLAAHLGAWLRAYSPLASQRQVSIELQVGEHENGALVVFGLAVDLQRAIGNLVSNGIKYARRGGLVTVSLRNRAVGPPDEAHPEAWVTIDVVDDGPGVPAGWEEQIFQREVQAVGARKGLGLGLSIARRVAVDHGGDVVALPASSGGHFRLTLPAHPTQATADTNRR